MYVCTLHGHRTISGIGFPIGNIPLRARNICPERPARKYVHGDNLPLREIEIEIEIER